MKPMPMTMLDLVTGLFVEPPDIVLRPLYIPQILRIMTDLKQVNINFAYSKTIAHFELGTLLSRIQPDTLTMFIYFNCFSLAVWLLILLSILACSLSLRFGSSIPRSFFEYYWHLTVIMFNKSLQLSIKRNISKNHIVIGTWLVSSLILSSLFVTYLLDYMISLSPVRKIDSLGDASIANDLTVLCSDDSTLMGYVHSEKDDPIAQRLSKKMEFFPDDLWFDRNFTVDMLTKLRSGSYALAHNKLTAIFLLYLLSELDENKKSNENIMDVIHVASDGGGYLPTFLSVNQDNTAFNLHDFDAM